MERDDKEWCCLRDSGLTGFSFEGENDGADESFGSMTLLGEPVKEASKDAVSSKMNLLLLLRSPVVWTVRPGRGRVAENLNELGFDLTWYSH